ncbi:hypothetical protein P43SY_005186 [Pythium insidiosum]|uniref:Major facilitator superfamily (MFS) profile domain-containing protein n=1 Tax=Pythium insidiosum TaxID=114742 RepID=A0AAD5QBQ1_PYTIN|nr:hypothetical protein P43SY_005186 [Pythium insidiosum]
MISNATADTCDPVADFVAVTQFNAQPEYIRACRALLGVKTLPADFCKDEKCLEYMRDNYKNLPNCIESNFARHARWRAIITSCDLSKKGASTCSTTDIADFVQSDGYLAVCSVNVTVPQVCADSECVEYMRKNLDTIPSCMLEPYLDLRQAWSAALETCSHPNAPKPKPTRKPSAKPPVTTLRPSPADAADGESPENPVERMIFVFFRAEEDLVCCMAIRIGEIRTGDSLRAHHSLDLKDRTEMDELAENSVQGRGVRPYAIATDPLENDRATEIKLLSAARPHMRAFHFAWFSFFIAFFGWFSIPPLMPTIKTQLHLTSDQVANSNIASVASTIVGRLVAGPLCDRYGSRTVQAVLLVLGALPVAAASLCTSYTGLVVVRFCIGFVGCSFVATANWTSVMFARDVVGTANALAAGWGNLGAGVTYLVTPFIFDLVTLDDSISRDLGWRIALLCPALLMVVVGILLYQFSDDTPQGQRGHQRDAKDGVPLSASGGKSLREPSATLMDLARMPVVWILAFQYACSFGVELQVHNELSLYYHEDFVRRGCASSASSSCRLLSQTKSGLISSLFGLTCLFARAGGGYLSDVAARRRGMSGRVSVQFAAFVGQAATLLAFSRMTRLAASIPCLAIFGIFVQACTGTTYGIVPFVSPSSTGSTSGVVGAGGNVGALAWGFLFKGVGDRRRSFAYLSGFVALAAALSPCIRIRIRVPSTRSSGGAAAPAHSALGSMAATDDT